jgi:5-methylcytosine-specific restriction endonuclease McrA
MDNGNPKNFDSLPVDQQTKIRDSKLLIYECEGEETEIKQWFETINIAGIPLNDQELLNAIYSGPFVTLAKAEFSYSQNANIQKWSAYIKGSANRQQFLERALDWVGKGDIGGYMSAHRNQSNINEMKTYFGSVIDWVSGVFVDVLPEMKGLEWGRLYEAYHGKSYDPKKMSKEVKKLISDDCVTTRKGIFEFLLGGSLDTKLLEVRVFDAHVKRVVYAKQTQAAEGKGKSNCPHCAIGQNANKSRIYKLDEMDADHVSAWSKGGESSAKNCQMLCTTHNRAKGNR